MSWKNSDWLKSFAQAAIELPFFFVFCSFAFHCWSPLRLAGARLRGAADDAFRIGILSTKMISLMG